MSAPLVSAVVVSYNTREDLLHCLAALQAVTLPLETIVVDNASTDGSVEAVRTAHPSVRVLENAENVGFSGANNRGLREARGAYFLVLNSDAEVRPGAVEAMMEALSTRPEVGIVGPRTVGGDGSPQVSFGPDLSLGSEWRQRALVRGVRDGRPQALQEAAARSAREQEPDWVSASCFLARREPLEKVAYFDEGFFLYEEDVDLCRRVREAGWRILYIPGAEVVHHLGRSVARDPGRARLEYQRSHLRYYRKHQGAGQTTLLRAHMGLGAAAGWLGALLGGDRDARLAQAAVFALALRGR